MFVLLLTYRAPLERMDELRPAHVAYLQEQYDAGIFIVSGRQRPPVGGVIITGDLDRARLERIIATDPYVTEGVAEYTVVEFGPTKVSSAVRHALSDAGVALP